jgi:hypothetical protein
MQTQRYIELQCSNNKTIKVDTFENLNILFDFDQNYQPESLTNNQEFMSDGLKNSSVHKLSEITNKQNNNNNNVELPKINIKTLTEYPQCNVNFKLPVNYIK